MLFFLARQPTFEEIQSLPTLMTMSEKSDSLTRCCFACWGCRGCRPLQMIIFEQGQETAKIDKPCKCGSCVGCPLEMTLRDSEGTEVGYVREFFTPYCGKCAECCCKCNYYHRVSGWMHVDSTSSQRTCDLTQLIACMHLLASTFLRYYE